MSNEDGEYKQLLIGSTIIDCWFYFDSTSGEIIVTKDNKRYKLYFSGEHPEISIKEVDE